MCLITRNKEPKVAEEDIVCYKVIAKCDDLHGIQYLTPYTLTTFPHEKGNIFIAKGLETIEPLICTYPYYHGTSVSISSGFVHTFKSEEDAKQMSWLLIPGDKVVFKCIIPKGTPYYEGNENGCVEGYASKVIKVIKEI